VALILIGAIPDFAAAVEEYRTAKGILLLALVEAAMAAATRTSGMRR